MFNFLRQAPTTATDPTRQVSSPGTNPPSPDSPTQSQTPRRTDDGGDASVDGILRQLSRLGDGESGFGEGSPVLEAAKTVKTQQTRAIVAMARATEMLNRLREALEAGASGRQEASEALSRELRRIKAALDGKEAKLVEDAERLLQVLTGDPTSAKVTDSLSGLGAALDNATTAVRAAAEETARQQVRKQEFDSPPSPGEARRQQAQTALDAQRAATMRRANQDDEDRRIAARQEREAENIRNDPVTRAELARMERRRRELGQGVAQGRGQDRGAEDIFEQMGMAARPGTTTRRRTGGKRRQRGGWQNKTRKKTDTITSRSTTRAKKRKRRFDSTRRRLRKK